MREYRGEYHYLALLQRADPRDAGGELERSPAHVARIGLHNDRSYFSASIVLRRADEGGELAFPRQGFNDAEIDVGWLLTWPAPITHPHMVHPVRRGRRVSMVVWTKD